MRINRSFPVTALASAIACSAGIAVAEQVEPTRVQDGPGIEQQAPESAGKTAAEEAAEDIRLGGFLLYPQIILGATFDDNIYATRQDQVDDVVMTVTPSIEVKSDWQRHVFNVRAGASISRYLDNSTENTDDYWLEAEGRRDLSERSNMFGGVRRARYHEDRESPDAVLGSEPTLYYDDTLYAGFAHRINDRLSTRLGGSLRMLDFEDSGAVNNDDRDRNVVTGGAWLGYRLAADTQLFMQAAVEQRDYDASLDDGVPENRDSEGYRVQAGAKWKRGRLMGDAYLGHMSQDYRDAALHDVSALDFGGSLTWLATERTTLRALLDRSIEETTLDGASSYLTTTLNVGVSHRIRPDLTFAASAAVSNADYQGNSREDDFLETNAGLTYDITRRVYLAANYRYMNRDSNVDAADFHRSQVSLTLGAYLYPRRQLPPSWETYAFAIEPSVDNRFGGFYIGLQAGHDILRTNTSRDDGTGTDIDDTSLLGHDLAWGLFGGYGWTRDRWYLGVELDGERGRANWNHYKSKANAPTFSVDKGDSFGASLRLGRMLDNGTLFYGRAGLVRTEFDTLYDNTDATPPDALVDQTFTETGKRFGIGIEVPETPHLFWRMDYAYTDYGSYVVDYGTAREVYSNDDSALRLGVGYRFGNQLAKRRKPVSFDHSGFYLGANVSHGALGSDVDGIHREDGIATPYVFDVDFGDQGVGAGVFAGYGKEFGNWYLGVEVDGDFSQAEWQHVRVVGGSPGGGRDFSVAKHDSYGLSGRLGYKLRSGTLVYMRAGLVRTSFETVYERGNNSATYIDREDRVDGKRIGFGADVPMTRDLLLRMDYAYTDYDSYAFTTTHGTGPDDMRYANWENLFRLGMAMRF